MEHLVSPDVLYGISGFCVGVLVGMTGVGGGSLMTPLLILLFGVHPTTAVGTDLLFAASTKATGTIVHAAAERSTGCEQRIRKRLPVLVPLKPRSRSAQDSNRSNHQQPEWKYAQARNGLQSQSRQ
jgi:Sulfite exporter TauE/SafE